MMDASQAAIDDGHGHAPEHTHGVEAFTPKEARQARRLALVLALVGGFFVVELGGALIAESVVLQADALHLLMDVLALAVSLLAMRLAVKRPTPRFTFGLRRVEPVAAIFSAGLVLVTTAGIVVEAVGALHQHAPPKAGVMLVVAIAALGVNGVSAWLLHDALGHPHDHAPDPEPPDDEGDSARAHDAHADGAARAGGGEGHALNLRGAALHLFGDTLGALVAIAAALAIRFGGARLAWADPVASLAVAVILLVGSVRLLRDATLVLLEAAPPHLSVAVIRAAILAFPGIDGVHDLHVWSLGAGHDAVTAHVLTSSGDLTIARRLAARLRDVLGVEYVTVQVEGTRGGA